MRLSLTSLTWNLILACLCITAAPAQAGLLDAVPGAKAGYSLRQLDNDYAGYAIQVRRSSDGTTSNIGFVGGQLDTASLSAFAAGGNAFVTTWYDQVGSAHVIQPNSANQPQIVAGGSVLTDPVNGLPALRFSNSKLNYANNWTGDTTTSVFSAAAWFPWTTPSSNNDNMARRLWTLHSSTATKSAVGGHDGQFALNYRDTALRSPLSGTSIVGNEPFVTSYLYDASQAAGSDWVRLRLDGTQIAAYTGLTLDSSVNGFTIGSGGDQLRPFDGLIQELVVYGSVLSAADMTRVEGNMMGLYIPEPGTLLLLSAALACGLLVRRR